jgi:hypothetical protein
MNLPVLSEMIGAIRQIEPSRRIVLFGSSSILASFPKETPETLGVEVTIDADVFLDPDDEQAREALLRIMGKGREYHLENGFYCDFVDARADEWFPPGWKQRVVPFQGHANVYAMHPVDSSAAKLVATAHSRVDKRMGRRLHDRGSKDIDTVVALVSSGHVDWQEVTNRNREISLESAYLAELAKVETEVVKCIEQRQTIEGGAVSSNYSTK